MKLFVRLKYHLNLLLLCANRSEKMASHRAGHCHFSFCFFGAGYPQIQPPLVCLQQLLPELYPVCQSPRSPAALGALACRWLLNCGSGDVGPPSVAERPVYTLVVPTAPRHLSLCTCAPRPLAALGPQFSE